MSLAGASIDIDKDANKAIYGKEEDVKDIIHGNQAVVPAAKPLVDLLDKTRHPPRASKLGKSQGAAEDYRQEPYLKTAAVLQVK